MITCPNCGGRSHTAAAHRDHMFAYHGVRLASLDEAVEHLMPDEGNPTFVEVWWSEESKVLSLGHGAGFWQLWLDTGGREHDGQPGGVAPVQLW